jgi:transcriptional regulator with XRE-family HTH domain
MRIADHLAADAILAELGARLARVRLERGWTQARVATAAGVSKRTLERLEAGQSTQLTSFVRVCRALDLAAGLDALVPPETVSPVAALRGATKARRRASGTRSAPEPAEPWAWGDEP